MRIRRNREVYPTRKGRWTYRREGYTHGEGGEEILEDVRAGVLSTGRIVIPDVGDLSPAQSGGGDTFATEIAAEKAKAEAAATAAAKAADTSVRIPEVGQIYISEIMFAGGSTLPQWIEISNGSRTEQVNLSGWTLTVENATADADCRCQSRVHDSRGNPNRSEFYPVNGALSPNRDVTTLTVDGRRSVVNLWTDQQVELILLDISSVVIRY